MPQKQERKQRLSMRERAELLAALHQAHAACKKTMNTVPIYSDIYDAATYALFNLDTLVEAVTGDRRHLHKLPFRG